MGAGVGGWLQKTGRAEMNMFYDEGNLGGGERTS
jgi:hypothetical protein